MIPIVSIYFPLSLEDGMSSQAELLLYNLWGAEIAGAGGDSFQIDRTLKMKVQRDQMWTQSTQHVQAS